MSTHKASDLHDFQAEMAYPRRKEDEVKIFCERVAICGLEESYKAEFVLQRAMFRVGLIVTFIFIIYEGSVITSQFEKDRIVFTDIPTGTLTPPFPKISVCFPVTVDADRIQQVLVVPKRAESLKTTFNLTNTDTIEYMKDTLSLNGHASAMGTPRHLFATRAADATVEALLQNGQDWRNLFFPTCQKVLSGCSYYGRPFDCCQVAKFITIWQLSCFQIDVNRADLNSVSDVVDTPQLQDTGLTFDVHTDWTHGVYQAGSASDGYHIFIDSHPTVTGDPVFIPSGMHALIVLKEPERLSELIGCRPLDSIPKLKRFDDYDPYGQQCTSEAASELLTSFIGCELPTLWYIPRDGCTFTQAFIISLAFSWDGVDDFQQTSAVFTDKFVREKYADVVPHLKALFSAESPCKPLCDRWSYKVLSASYGAIQYCDAETSIRELSNQSWSRIQVTMPSASAWSHTERFTGTYYVLICKIGSVMGSCAGISMITLAHIIAYGAYVLWKRKKRGTAVGPLEEAGR